MAPPSASSYIGYKYWSLFWMRGLVILFVAFVIMLAAAASIRVVSCRVQPHPCHRSMCPRAEGLVQTARILLQGASVSPGVRTGLH